MWTDKKPHYLRENKTCSIPKRVIFFDTETYSKDVSKTEHEQSFRLGVGVYQKTKGKQKAKEVDWIETTSPGELCNWILSKPVKKERLYAICSNVWFDMRISTILKYLRLQQWKLKQLYVNGLTIIITFTLEKKTIVFLNFQNYFPMTVKKVGKSLHLPKLEVDFNNVSERDLFIYCKRDVEIIQRAMNYLFDFIKNNDLGQFALTAPSLAFNAYRHRFMPVKILVHTNTKAVELERASYFGGRTECLRIGRYSNKNLVEIDINDMYGYVMKTFEYPCCFKYYTEKATINSLRNFLENMCCTAYVRVKTDEPAYCIRSNHRCLFPLGEFNVYLSSPSLNYALLHNHIIKVYKVACYRKAFLFGEYVDFFANLRTVYQEAGNDVFALLCKLELVSFYGKFGQRADKVMEKKKCGYDLITRENYFDMDTDKHYVTTQFFGSEVTVEKNTLEGINSIVAIASHVTDNARALLWKYQKRIGRENIYYSDTDSIIFDRKNVDMSVIPIHPTKAGSFKIVQESTEINIKGLKDYIWGGKVKIKGVSSKAIKISTNKYIQPFFPGIYTELRNGLDKPYTIVDRPKNLKREYKKGIVGKSGKVTPFVFK